MKPSRPEPPNVKSSSDASTVERARHEAARRGMSAPADHHAEAFLRDVDAGLAGAPISDEDGETET